MKARILVLSLPLIALAGCGFAPATPSSAPMQVRLDTADGPVGVFRDGKGIHLVLNGQDTGGQDPGGTGPTVHLFALSGETGQQFNSFVYGLAPPNTATVELTGLQAIGGTVTDGMYVLAIRTKDVLPMQLNWTFKSPAGGVVAQGSNITP